jgi:hypothetical protein
MRVADMYLLVRVRRPHSLDLNPLDYHVWAYIKNREYESNEDARGDLLQRISDARQVNNPEAPTNLTCPLLNRIVCTS